MPFDKRIFPGRFVLGPMAVGFYIIHGTYWVLRGVPENLLWACHIGSLAVGLGIMLNRSRVNAVGVLWLVMGNMMWFLYLSGGGKFEPTSPLTHIGGLVIGIVALQRFGIPKHSWIWALACLAMLQQVSRWATPPGENVNLAFRVHEGWGTIFPSYPLYMVVLFFMAGGLFFCLEQVLQKIRKN